MKKIVLIVIMLTGLNAISQNSFVFSGYTDMETIKGFELRQEYSDWYMSFFGEEKGDVFSWGGSIGLKNEYRSFQYDGGVRVGLTKINGVSAPLYGLESSVVYNASEVFLIGFKLAYNRKIYKDENVDGISEFNPSVKIGLRF